MKVRFQDCFLHVNDTEILLSHHICGLIELDDLVLVLVYGLTAEQLENLPTTNIYAFDEHAKQVWQIEEPSQYSDQRVCYADISLRKINRKEEVVAGTTRGDEYIVNTKDGSVSFIKGQRPW